MWIAQIRARTRSILFVCKCAHDAERHQRTTADVHIQCSLCFSTYSYSVNCSIGTYWICNANNVRLETIEFVKRESVASMVEACRLAKTIAKALEICILLSNLWCHHIPECDSYRKWLTNSRQTVRKILRLHVARGGRSHHSQGDTNTGVICGDVHCVCFFHYFGVVAFASCSSAHWSDAAWRSLTPSSDVTALRQNGSHVTKDAQMPSPMN